MKTNRILSVVIAIALTVTAVFVVQSAIDTSTINDRAKESQAFNTDAARWEALGEYYAKQKANISSETQRIRDINAARWEALGAYYANQKANTNFDAQHIRDVNAARWAALGAYYAQQKTNINLDDQHIRDVNAARWAALGAYYAQQKANTNFDASPSETSTPVVKHRVSITPHKR